MVQVGIIGGSGFTGAELLRLLAAHTELQLAWTTGDSQAGESIAGLYPSLAPIVGTQRFEPYRPELLGDVELVFCALPHGASQALMGDLLEGVDHVVDLGADFRLPAADYEQWYGEVHSCPDLLDRFAYGLPELDRTALTTRDHVAVPGCYPTTATLALLPLVRAGFVDTSSVIVDAASGVSGAGRPPKPHTTFCAVDEDFVAYGLLDHRHTPEMERNLSASVLFTPHLVPMTRGILATCYAQPAVSGLTTASLMECLHEAYDDEPFVTVVDAPPSTKATMGSNSCHVTVRFDERTGTVLALAALDNLVKGASGQAIQCANVLVGLPETTGLPVAGLYP